MCIRDSLYGLRLAAGTGPLVVTDRLRRTLACKINLQSGVCLLYTSQGVNAAFVWGRLPAYLTRRSTSRRPQPCWL